MWRNDAVILNPDDRKLVRRLRRGDERAFDEFFDGHFPRLFRFALSRMPADPETAREVVQDTLVRALDRLGQYRGESSLFTWLCAICRNELVDRCRRDARYRDNVVFIDDHPAIRATLEAFTAPAAEGPMGEARRAEARRLIQLALDHLPSHYGDALEWKYVEGRSVREIGQRLGISVEAAQSLLARAKRAFRELYGSLVEAAGADVTPLRP